jgi:hypothetical protein
MDYLLMGANLALASRVWKEITLNSTSDQVEYRVWDYPIKEQYGHILQAITQVGPVKTIREGFQKVGTLGDLHSPASRN